MLSWWLLIVLGRDRRLTRDRDWNGVMQTLSREWVLYVHLFASVCLEKKFLSLKFKYLFLLLGLFDLQFCLFQFAVLHWVWRNVGEKEIVVVDKFVHLLQAEQSKECNLLWSTFCFNLLYYNYPCFAVWVHKFRQLK